MFIQMRIVTNTASQNFRTFLKIVDPAFVKDYDSYKAGQLRADVMRFYIMYYFGGEFLLYEFILGKHVSPNATKQPAIDSLWR